MDLLGVVTNVGALGSVKRKSDQSELQRRDITLLDQRCAPRLLARMHMYDWGSVHWGHRLLCVIRLRGRCQFCRQPHEMKSQGQARSCLQLLAGRGIY